MDASDITAAHSAEWREAILQYGDAFHVPEEVSFAISERWRARHCMLLKPDQHPTATMREYNIAASIAREFECPGWTPPVKRESKTKAFFDWCNEHVGEQITAQQLAEAHDFSPATAAARIRDNVGIFARLKKGLYEIRDPKIERQRELTT